MALPFGGGTRVTTYEAVWTKMGQGDATRGRKDWRRGAVGDERMRSAWQRRGCRPPRGTAPGPPHAPLLTRVCALDDIGFGHGDPRFEWVVHRISLSSK